MAGDVSLGKGKGMEEFVVFSTCPGHRQHQKQKWGSIEPRQARQMACRQQNPHSPHTRHNPRDDRHNQRQDTQHQQSKCKEGQSRHEKEQWILEPIHYLKLLSRKPRAFERAKPIKIIKETWPEYWMQYLNWHIDLIQKENRVL